MMATIRMARGMGLEYLSMDLIIRHYKGMKETLKTIKKMDMVQFGIKMEYVKKVIGKMIS